MKKTLAVLFLLLTMVSFTKSYYGKEESLSKVYSEMNLKRPALKNKTAQNITDEFTRIIYESLTDISITPVKDQGKLTDYYSIRTNAILKKLEQNQASFSQQDTEILLTHINKLYQIVELSQ